jgi:hypothetical protein
MQTHQRRQLERIQPGASGGGGIDLQRQARLAEAGVVVDVAETGVSASARRRSRAASAS